MCNTWKHPSDPKREVGCGIYEKLPSIKTINVTGGEPFLREDLHDVVTVLKRKSRRLVISSNGYLTDRVVDLFEKHPDIGIRVSIEGFPAANDMLRGLKDGFDHGIRTLTELSHMGIRDIGFGITVSDGNAKDLVELYRLSKMMGLEFATAAIHNSFYFHKLDNKFENPEIAINEFERLVDELLDSSSPKDWFRAWFNCGLINYIRGGRRLLPCDMGVDAFFLDPHGEIFACNVLEESMGNLTDNSFNEIWTGSRADEIRKLVRNCEKNCWMMGSVGQQMKKYPYKPTLWVARKKLKSLMDVFGRKR